MLCTSFTRRNKQKMKITEQISKQYNIDTCMLQLKIVLIPYTDCRVNVRLILINRTCAVCNETTEKKTTRNNIKRTAQKSVQKERESSLTAQNKSKIKFGIMPFYVAKFTFWQTT